MASFSLWEEDQPASGGFDLWGDGPVPEVAAAAPPSATALAAEQERQATGTRKQFDAGDEFDSGWGEAGALLTDPKFYSDLAGGVGRMFTPSGQQEYATSDVTAGPMGATDALIRLASGQGRTPIELSSQENIERTGRDDPANRNLNLAGAVVGGVGRTVASGGPLLAGAVQAASKAGDIGLETEDRPWYNDAIRTAVSGASVAVPWKVGEAVANKLWAVHEPLKRGAYAILGNLGVDLAALETEKGTEYLSTTENPTVEGLANALKPSMLDLATLAPSVAASGASYGARSAEVNAPPKTDAAEAEILAETPAFNLPGALPDPKTRLPTVEGATPESAAAFNAREADAKYAEFEAARAAEDWKEAGRLYAEYDILKKRSEGADTAADNEVRPGVVGETVPIGRASDEPNVLREPKLLTDETPIAQNAREVEQLRSDIETAADSGEWNAVQQMRIRLGELGVPFGMEVTKKGTIIPREIYQEPPRPLRDEQPILPARDANDPYLNPNRTPNEPPESDEPFFKNDPNYTVSDNPLPEDPLRFLEDPTVPQPVNHGMGPTEVLESIGRSGEPIPTEGYGELSSKWAEAKGDSEVPQVEPTSRGSAYTQKGSSTQITKPYGSPAQSDKYAGSINLKRTSGDNESLAQTQRDTVSEYAAGKVPESVTLEGVRREASKQTLPPAEELVSLLDKKNRLTKNIAPAEGVAMMSEWQRLTDLKDNKKISADDEAYLKALTPVVNAYSKESGQNLSVFRAALIRDHLKRGNYKAAARSSLGESFETRDAGKGEVKSQPAGHSQSDVGTKPRSGKTAYGASNKIVTKAMADKAKKNILDKMGRTNAGIDPTILKDYATIGAYHIEAGAMEFGAWSSKMIGDLGDEVRPHLKQIWDSMGTRSQTQDEIMKELDRLPNDPEKIAEFVFRKSRQTQSLIHTFHISNLLSNPISQGVNASASAANLIMNTALRNPKEWNEAFRGLALGASEGASRASFAFRKGYTKRMVSEGQTHKARGFAAGGAKNPFNMGTRALSAVDEFFGALAETSALRIEGQREAAKKLKPGTPEFKKFVDDYAAKPSEEAMKRAQKYADETLFREKVGKSVGQSGESKLQRAIGHEIFGAGTRWGLAPGKLVIPFFNTVTNALITTARYTPAGAVSAVWRDDKAKAIIQAAIGTAMLAPFIQWAEEGIITGAMPKDAKEREAFQRSGKQPNRIRIFGQYVPLATLGPLALPAMTAAAWVDANKAAKKSGKEDGSVWLDALGRIVKSGVDISALTGLDGLMDAVTGTTADAERFAGNMASGFNPLSGTQTFLNNTFDQYARDPEKSDSSLGNIGRNVQARSLAGALLPRRVDSLGQEVKRVGSFAGPEDSDPVWQKLYDLGVGPSALSKDLPKAPGQKTADKATPEEYRQILRARGPVYDLLQRQFAAPEFSALPEDQQRLIVERILNSTQVSKLGETAKKKVRYSRLAGAASSTPR